jgi:hypothetical protein
MLALTLALAWVPLASHCQLESASGLAFLPCAADDQPAAHCDGGSCCAVESGNYLAPTHQQIVPVLAIALLPFVIVADLERSSLPRVGPCILASAPPELSRAWQFALRTAPLCRAPSILS